MSHKQVTDVNPVSWTPSNRVGLLPWVYKTFNRSKYGEEDPAAIADCVGTPDNEQCEAAPKSQSQRFFPHQRIVRDIIQLDSPYRGLLLFHSLGTGKSATSIAAAEGFTARHRKVHVLVPASLEQNYRDEIRRYANVGRGFRGKWIEVRIDPTIDEDKDAYKVLHRIHRLNADHFKTTNGKAWIPYVPEDFPKSKVVREVMYKDMTSADMKKVDKTIDRIIDARYRFTNYNGLTLEKVNQLDTKDFDNSFVIIDEAHNFIRMIANNSVIARKLYKHLTEAKDMKIVLLSGTPIINHPYELGLMLNLVRGMMVTHQLGLLKGSNTPIITDIEERLKKKGVWRQVDSISVSPDGSSLDVTLIDAPYIRTAADGASSTMLVRMSPSQAASYPSRHNDIIESIRTALAPEIKIGKRTKEVISSAFPLKKTDFDALFLDSTDPKNPRIKNTDLFMRRSIGLVSYLRTAGEELFPRVTGRMIKTIPLTDYSFLQYAEVRDKEIKMDDRRNKRMLARGAINGIMDQSDPIVYRAFSRMACNFTFPKGIKRQFPGDIKKALKREISAADDVDIDHQVEEEGGKLDIPTKAKKDYEEHKRRIMDELAAGASSYLSQNGLRNKYSSKMAAIIDDIKSSPGKTLVYSQFREIEGIGVLRTSLLSQGWAEIDLERIGNDYSIVDADRVLSPVFNGKRFVVFSDDRAKTAVFLNIFNGRYDSLPQQVQQQLSNLPRKNLYGETASLMMVTAAAAEGISLRAVRRVLIMEPFWNMVRMDQVIGRAVRAGSHLDLPLEDRTVEVFIYAASLTDEQLKNDFTLKTKDDGLSSDQSIIAVAERKNGIIEQFLSMIRSSAIDCTIHSRKNKPLQNGFQCYSFPINLADDSFSYVPDIQLDQTPVNMRNIREKTVRARAVAVKNRKYVAYGDPPKLYDYAAYTEAGVLIPAST
ncbi:hypothetical protein [Dishui Lake large algae virus 1]|nr:hypothetical protein [Dishui Lake large algae virus 1]